MNRTDLAAAVAERLRREGVYLRPAEWDVLVASLPDEAAGADVAALTERYLKESRAYLMDARQSRFSGRLILFGLFYPRSAWHSPLAARFAWQLDASNPNAHGAVVCGAVCIIGGLGVAAYGCLPYVRMWPAQRQYRHRADQYRQRRWVIA